MFKCLEPPVQMFKCMELPVQLFKCSKRQNQFHPLLSEKKSQSVILVSGSDSHYQVDTNHRHYIQLSTNNNMQNQRYLGFGSKNPVGIEPQVNSNSREHIDNIAHRFIKNKEQLYMLNLAFMGTFILACVSP
ncbi:hypothetical protein ACLB2K_070121 [Fragaria x ananassa]